MPVKKRKTARKKSIGSALKSFQKSVYGSAAVKAAKKKIAVAERMYKAAVKAAHSKHKKRKRAAK